MLNWLFKKPGPAAAPASSPKPARAAPSTTPATPAPPAKAAAPTAPRPDETPLLHAAMGDDAALLKLAQSAQTLAVKMAAVQALAGEDALLQAERSFRSHDRKVHRLAKQRLEAAVAQREARARADALLVRTTALLGEAAVPVNHVVELDRDWAALPAPALEPAQQQQFDALRARLDTQMREHEAAQQRLKQWTAEVRRELAAWPAAAAQLAATGSAADAAQRLTAFASLQGSCPEAPATAALQTALAAAVQLAAQVHTRLQRMEAPVVDATTAQPAPGTPPELPPELAPGLPAELPPLPPELARLFAAREAALRPAPRSEAPPASADMRGARQAAKAAADEARRAAQQQRIAGLVVQAEAALADGRLAEIKQHLQAIDSSLSRAHVTLPEALRHRVHALQAERSRLQAWQHWGGTRARDDLIAEAEALARATGAILPAAAPPAQPVPPSPDATDAAADAVDATATAPAVATAEAAPPPAPAPHKLNLKAHADGIQALRKRWKALDHQGDVASAEQWRRFDAALHLAYEPVAAQHAALKAARLENLAAREALLDALETAAGGAEGASANAAAAAADAGDGAAPEPEHGAAVAAPDWRARAAELDRFQTAWRKLGPVEHTVPSAAREALMQRLQATLARVEAPLQQARAAAGAEREQLIAHAEALLPRGGEGRDVADAPRRVRELQAAWQDHARRLPLPRGLEGALWARFKAATDAVFAQREAAFAARDAEAAAHIAEREALLQQLSALGETSTAAEIEHTLATTDRAWRHGGELPRGAAEALDARWRAARAAVVAVLDAAHRCRWHTHCDTLAARVALCEQREDGSADAATLAARWAAPDSLPAAWRQALAQRWAAAPTAGPLDKAALDTLLLRLESALAVPSAPEWQAARQQLKLLALKDTMEGRTPAGTGPRDQAGWLQAAVRQAGLGAAQRQRLHTLLAALRQATPGALGTVDDGS
ncbi:MAG: hypothetical protein C0505_08395 [Leptothrix sp. (in: Bacteria)]|nr:hypothetical protein [Leptothrix sp. (in: b-proteobacteria)]